MSSPGFGIAIRVTTPSSHITSASLPPVSPNAAAFAQATFQPTVFQAFSCTADHLIHVIAGHRWGHEDPLLRGLSNAIAIAMTVPDEAKHRRVWWEAAISVVDQYVAFCSHPSFVLEPPELIISVLSAFGRIWRQTRAFILTQLYDATNGWLVRALVHGVGPVFANIWNSRHLLKMQPVCELPGTTELRRSLSLSLYSFSLLVDMSVGVGYKGTETFWWDSFAIEAAIACWHVMRSAHDCDRLLAMETVHSMIHSRAGIPGILHALSAIIPSDLSGRQFMDRLLLDFEMSSMVDGYLLDLSIVALQAVRARPGLLAGNRQAAMKGLFQAFQRQSHTGSSDWGWNVWKAISGVLRETYMEVGYRVMPVFTSCALNLDRELPSGTDIVTHAARGIIYAAKSPQADVGLAVEIATDASEYIYQLMVGYRRATMFEDLQLSLRPIWRAADVALSTMDPITNIPRRTKYNYLAYVWRILGELLEAADVPTEDPEVSSMPSALTSPPPPAPKTCHWGRCSQPSGKTRRCRGCGVLYCSKFCQAGYDVLELHAGFQLNVCVRRDWKMDGHKADCRRLKAPFKRTTGGFYGGFKFVYV
ncbi:hypothetical protein OF83DRAFT_1084458 [Amylostereum chailletii]|nr:hypothetical protein OF83DRAFT_1084458 [Amylostereum chailletii]